MEEGHDLLCNQNHWFCTGKHCAGACTPQGHDNLSTIFHPRSGRFTPEHRQAHPGGESQTVWKSFWVTWYSFLNIPAEGPVFGRHRVCWLEKDRQSRLWALLARARLGTSRLQSAEPPAADPRHSGPRPGPRQGVAQRPAGSAEWLCVTYVTALQLPPGTNRPRPREPRSPLRGFATAPIGSPEAPAHWALQSAFPLAAEPLPRQLRGLSTCNSW